jgi:tetratricopeptide (TPR) repeat protein
VPDSAFYWYEKSLAWDYSPIRSPRILYILAELSRMNTGKEYPTPEEYYTRLDHDFPESIYAEEARRFLGKESSVKKTDNAAIYYEQAEKQIETKQYNNAIKEFRNIAQSYPKSPLAAKSEYAIGWIFENHLEQPESAMVQYKHVVKNYDGTKYAISAANRLAGAVQNEKAKLDSAKINAAKMDTMKMNTGKIDTSKNNNASMDTSKIKLDKENVPKIRHAKVDTSNMKIVKMDTSKSNAVNIDTSKMKTTKIDSSEINSSPMNQKAPGPVGARKDSVASRKRIIE